MSSELSAAHPGWVIRDPVFYGRWDEAAQRHATLGVAERHQVARTGYFAGLEPDVPAVKAALRKLTAHVLLYAGDRDPLVTPAMVSAGQAWLQRKGFVTRTPA